MVLPGEVKELERQTMQLPAAQQERLQRAARHANWFSLAGIVAFVLLFYLLGLIQGGAAGYVTARNGLLAGCLLFVVLSYINLSRDAKRTKQAVDRYYESALQDSDRDTASSAGTDGTARQPVGVLAPARAASPGGHLSRPAADPSPSAASSETATPSPSQGQPGPSPSVMHPELAVLSAMARRKP